MADIKYIKVSTLKDLVLVAITVQIPLILRVRREDKDILFLPFLGTGDGIVYLHEVNQPLNCKFIAYNKLKGDISLTIAPSDDARYSTVAIIDVAEQNILSEKFFNKLSKEAKSKKKKSK